MKLTKRKKRCCYVKLFKMFESELKNYDELFKDDNYILNYIVCRDYFGNEDEIKVVLKIHTGAPMRALNFENFNLKTLLMNYCKYFSIKDIIIMKSARTEIEGSKSDPTSINIPKIQDRVFFEYFRMIDKYVEIR